LASCIRFVLYSSQPAAGGLFHQVIIQNDVFFWTGAAEDIACKEDIFGLPNRAFSLHRWQLIHAEQYSDHDIIIQRYPQTGSAAGLAQPIEGQGGDNYLPKD
jgi:hypothetical protein